MKISFGTNITDYIPLRLVISCKLSAVRTYFFVLLGLGIIASSIF